MTLEELNAKLGSTAAKRIIFAVGATVFTLVIFQAGILVGYHNAAYSFRFGDSYFRVFGGDSGFVATMPARGPFMNANGARGTIMSVDLPSIVVEDPGNVEKVITINGDTLIRRDRDIIASSSLRAGESVIIIGSPDEDGDLDARLIRIMPAATAATGTALELSH